MARSSLWNSPFVAFLLGITVTGLGHVYLRRWLRAFGWVLVAVTVTFFFVPESAIEALAQFEQAPLGDVYPIIVVGLLSAMDASLVALRVRATDESGSAEGIAADADGAPNAGEEPTCPHCGGDVDPELGFCHWCTREFETPSAADATGPE